MSYELSIIGAGNMAEAIVRGLLAAKRLSPAQIVAADVSPARRELFASLGVRAVEKATDATGASTALLSVKPQQMADVLASLGPVLRPDVLLISIAAGKSTAFIEKHLGGGRDWRVVRAMPNTPMLIGEGMAGICRGAHATDADMVTARRLFEASAAVVEVPEELIDGVTAISGSGPAYFYFLVEQLIQAGVEMGFTEQQAHLLATKTALGAAKLMLASSDTPKELRRKVTSPGGTTQAALEVMESRGVPESLRAAFHRAAQRGRELAAG